MPVCLPFVKVFFAQVIASGVYLLCVFYFCVFVICSCWLHCGSLRKWSNTRKMISILSCFNPTYLRLPTSLTPGFKHGFPNLQEQHCACWCEDFLGQRLWTYLSTDTWVAMRSQECNGTLVSNEVVDFVILLCWILTCCFGDIWCFLTKKSGGTLWGVSKIPFQYPLCLNLKPS